MISLSALNKLRALKISSQYLDVPDKKARHTDIRQSDAIRVHITHVTSEVVQNRPLSISLVLFIILYFI